jgi:hypothetical protein
MPITHTLRNPSRGLLPKGFALLFLCTEAQAVVSFDAEIRPILKEHCAHCHGEEEDPKGGIDLRLRRFMNGKTEDDEPLLSPGDPSHSALFRVVAEGKMPKKGKKIPEAQLETLRRWIAEGAPGGAPEPDSLPPGPYFTDADRSFWSFRPVQRPEIPHFEDAPDLAPMDALLRKQLRDQGFDFAPEADRATLLRRLTLDLTGLPPTPQETDAFLADTTPDAYAKQVDRLLASPAYGERWGRHWLDVAGYADTNGYADADSVRPHLWRYRDYVIRSFNADKPWDRFIQEQLAGDELAGLTAANAVSAIHDPARLDSLTATGFLRTAPDGTGDTVADVHLARNQNIADTLRIVTTSLTSLTVACAQCHDHRYDPISQADYYRLRAVFDPALDWKKWLNPAQRTVSLYNAEERERAAEIEKKAAEIDAEANRLTKEALDVVFEMKILEVPEAERAEYRIARNTPAAQRTPKQAALLKKYFSAQATFGLDLYDKEANKKVLAKRAEATALRATKPPEAKVQAVLETQDAKPVSQIHHRGDYGQLRQTVTPGELSVLSGPNIPADDDARPTTGRRLAYAKWLTSGRHPLVGRALMNRVWMHHFGRGIVNTPGDFGALGERPSHPELLDYLADRFVQTGWSLKAMHREILFSRAYRQSSRNDSAQAADPDNVLVGRFRIQRLDAETLRDSMLAVSGKLNPEPFGPPVAIGKTGDGRLIPGVEIRNVNGDVTKVDNTSPAVFRRSVYLQHRRTAPATALATFDLPDMEPNCERRDSTTSAPQSLFLMNDEFVIDRGKDLAARVIAEHPANPADQIRAAWRLTQGRSPAPNELATFERLLAEQTQHFEKLVPPQPRPAAPPKPADPASLPAAPPASAAAAPAPTTPAPTATAPPTPALPTPHALALGSLCQALLVSNRFLYVD